MKFAELLKCKSLKDARLVVPPIGNGRPITGVNVLEAPDIEKWGSKGMLLLTSYFGLVDLDQDELQVFVDKLKTIGISALIVKIERLIDEIPGSFISMCIDSDIPLIEIGKNTKYEGIIVEVLGSILTRREQSLERYYHVSQLSSKMSIEMLAPLEILQEFEQFLQMDLTLWDMHKKTAISTNPRLEHYDVQGEVKLEPSEYMSFNYKRYRCKYVPANQPAAIVQVDISTVEPKRYLLVVHEKEDHSVDENDIILIENLVRSLQLELLREYSSKQRQRLNKNSLVNELLHGSVFSAEELTLVYDFLGFKPAEKARVMVLNYYPSGLVDRMKLADFRNNLRAEIQQLQNRAVYFIAARFDEFILPVESSQAMLKAKFYLRMLNTLWHEISPHTTLSFYGGISEPFKISDIKQADTQARGVANFLQRNYANNMIEETDNLGIFKLFIGDDQRDLTDYINPEIRQLHSEHPLLFETLATYLRVGRSYKQAGEELFLHPKTVKYRIEKTSSLLQTDLTNTREVAMLLVSMEIIAFQADARR